MSAQFIKADEGGKQVCGLLNGQAVSSFRLRLPRLSDTKLQRALPHIMSDYLSDDGDISFCHMSLGDDHSLVLACEKSLLDDIMRQAQAEKLEVRAIWPDYMELPQPDDGLAICEQDGDVLARRADGTGFRLPKQLADAAIGEIKTVTVERATLPDAPGFATGRFGTQLPVGEWLTAMKRPLLIGATAITVWLFATLYGGIAAHQKSTELAERGEELFRKKFPEVRRVVNVEAQLRNQLGNVGGASFSAYGAQLLTALQALPDARLETIEFIGGRTQSLDITLTARNFSVLENARQKLAASGFRVEEGKSEQSAKLVTARFTLIPAGGRR